MVQRRNAGATPHPLCEDRGNAESVDSSRGRFAGAACRLRPAAPTKNQKTANVTLGYVLHPVAFWDADLRYDQSLSATLERR